MPRNRSRPPRPGNPRSASHARRQGLRLVQPEPTNSDHTYATLDLEGNIQMQLLSMPATHIGTAVGLPIQPGEMTQLVDDLKSLMAQFVATRFVRMLEGTDPIPESAAFTITISLEPLEAPDAS